MTVSCLPTEQERVQFAKRLDQWLTKHLPYAPLDQLQAIETAMFRYRPGVRTSDAPAIYGANGSAHLFGGG